MSELRQKYKLTELLETAGVPRSTYYYYLKDAAKPDKYVICSSLKYETDTIYGKPIGLTIKRAVNSVTAPPSK